MNSYIEVRGVSKKFQEETVIKEISLKLEKGKIYGFVGKNGSGKTVFFKLLAGILRATAGEIIVDGKKLGKEIDFPGNMGIMIETPGFLKQYSGYKNLEYLAKIRNVISKEQIQKAIEMVGLDPANKKRVGKYSLGMRQRLGIAQAIMEEPDLLILDEPMNSLDEEGIQIVRNVLKSMREKGTCILIASHYKEDIDLLCDTVYTVEKGIIQELKA